MVECDSGRDEQNANESTIMMHGSWHNVAEAELAMRCARRSPVLPVLRGPWLTVKAQMPGPELMPCISILFRKSPNSHHTCINLIHDACAAWFLIKPRTLPGYEPMR